MDFDEGFLRGVLSALIVAQDAPGNPVESLLVLCPLPPLTLPATVPRHLV